MVNPLNKKQIHTLEILSEIDENNQTLLNTTGLDNELLSKKIDDLTKVSSLMKVRYD
jgi:hypothetical protein